MHSFIHHRLLPQPSATLTAVKAPSSHLLDGDEMGGRGGGARQLQRQAVRQHHSSLAQYFGLEHLFVLANHYHMTVFFFSSLSLGGVLTSGLPRAVHGDLYGSVVSGHLGWVREYCDCQREALACKTHKKEVQAPLVVAQCHTFSTGHPFASRLVVIVLTVGFEPLWELTARKERPNNGRLWPWRQNDTYTVNNVKPMS